MATAERIAGRYTNAIMNYRKVLDSAADDRLKRLVHLNLGKIYYNQSLFAESLTHFSEAMSLDDKDPGVKIWTGKSYAALGFRDKARALWSEVLNADKTNEEARKLLGVL